MVMSFHAVRCEEIFFESHEALMNVVVAVLLEKMVSHEPEGGKGQHSLGPVGTPQASRDGP
jgi:hypothetical protein